MTVAVVPEVRLTLPARAEGVGVVRQALAGMADALAFNAAVVADMKMAVTEACTNVVVHAYEEHGPGLVDELNGIFAFALWDERERRLVAARDHFGVKPLYWWTDGRRRMQTRLSALDLLVRPRPGGAQLMAKSSVIVA